MHAAANWITLDLSAPVWDRFHLVAPLFVVGTMEANGDLDMAPKHLGGPMSWDNHFGFVCSPTHATYKNIVRDEVFTVSFPRPDQLVLASLAASGRCGDGRKPVVQALPTCPASVIEGKFLLDSYLGLECKLDRIVENLGRNILILGEVVAAHVHEDALLVSDGDPHTQIAEHPLLAYLPPGRFARIKETYSFPFPEDFRR